MEWRLGEHWEEIWSQGIPPKFFNNRLRFHYFGPASYVISQLSDSGPGTESDDGTLPLDWNSDFESKSEPADSEWEANEADNTEDTLESESEGQEQPHVDPLLIRRARLRSQHRIRNLAAQQEEEEEEVEVVKVRPPPPVEAPPARQLQPPPPPPQAVIPVINLEAHNQAFSHVDPPAIFAEISDEE